MIALRPHQLKFANDIREAFKTKRSVLGQAPVGFGKTVVTAYIAKNVLEKGNTMFFCVHTKDLLTQTYKAFDKFKIPFGIIASGYAPSKSKIQICSIPTLKNRLHKYNAPSILVIDECHFSGSVGWSKMINHYKKEGSFILGMSGSPCRLSGEGLGDQFDVMIDGVSTKWLIDNNYLSKYRIFAPSSPNLSNTHIKMGDYVQSEIEDIMSKPSITGCAIDNYKKHALGKNSIVFCTSIKHSKMIADSFNQSGIKAAHLDGECTIDYRKDVIRKFADGEIKIITNCALFSAGFDLSLQVDKDITVESVILLRPTQSLALFIQMTGRSLRYKTDPAIILDHANCCLTHGFPDDEREWTLEGTKKSKKSSDEKQTHIKSCPKCFACQVSGRPACQYCGFEFPIEAREVEQKEGDLVEVDLTAVRKIKKIEQGTANTLEKLIELGKSRGYKNPSYWARCVINNRQQKNKC